MTGILEIPTVDYSAAHSAALRARRAGTAADACLDDLAAALAPAWSGVASQAYLDGRAMVSREATALSQACDAMSRGIVDFADEAAAVLPGWRHDAERLAQLERGATDPAVLGIDPADVVAVEATITERDRLREAVAVWERRYDEAGMQLASACQRATTLLDDGVLSTADQLWAIPTTLMRTQVVEPAEAVAMLVDDPSLVDDFAKASVLGLWDQVTHPVRTAREAVGAEYFERGEWGEGTGTSLGSFVGALWLRRAMMDVHAGRTVRPDGSSAWPPPKSQPMAGHRWMMVDELLKYRRHYDLRDETDAPRPQTLDEMRAGVDLDRSEHPTLGHTLSRHVDVGDDYLYFRLTDGTPLNDGSVGRPQTTVSEWTDRATAEEALTTIMQTATDDELRDVMGPGNGKVKLTLLDPDGFGRVLSLGPEQPDGTRAVIRTTANFLEVDLVRKNGMLYVGTTRLSTIGVR